MIPPPTPTALLDVNVESLTLKACMRQIHQQQWLAVALGAKTVVTQR
jgi:hypothetical protein